MITELANSTSKNVEFIKWVSERNTHIPISEIEFLMGYSAFEHEDDE